MREQPGITILPTVNDIERDFKPVGKPSGPSLAKRYGFASLDTMHAVLFPEPELSAVPLAASEVMVRGLVQIEPNDGGELFAG